VSGRNKTRDKSFHSNETFSIALLLIRQAEEEEEEEEVVVVVVLLIVPCSRVAMHAGLQQAIKSAERHS
jgi:hypothetical protein